MGKQIVNDNNINLSEKELQVYNKIFAEANIPIDKRIKATNFSIVKKYYAENKKSKIIMINNEKGVELILSSHTNICLEFTNISYFEKIILPEILKMYSLEINKLDKEEKVNKFNRTFYKVNNNLYLLNFYDEVADSNIRFLYNLVNKKNYLLELNKNLIINETDEIPNFSNNIPTRKSYNYGYINILLVSFILSLLTIIVCLLKM